MAKRMEKRSARILAFLLALIMLGSVFAYMMRSGNVEKREVLLKLNDFREYVNITPKGAYYFEYVNLKQLVTLDREDPLRQFVEKKLNDLLVRSIFSRTVLEVPGGFEEIFVASYNPAVSLYFVNTNMSKVYFAKDSEVKYGNFTVQLRKGGLALIDELSPFVVGYTPLVRKVVDVVEGREDSVGNETYKYLSRINGSFVYASFVYGDVAKQAIKAENESVADFFFEGYRYNATNGSYEKVWAMHFIGNFFFGKMNKTEQKFEYYRVYNFNDGFGIAVMGDKNFTKVVEARPRILSWKIEIK